MALVFSDEFKILYEPEIKNQYKGDEKALLKELFVSLVRAPWRSSGLAPDNAFTTTLVLRTYGFLKQAGYVDLNSLPLRDWHLPLADDKETKAPAKKEPPDSSVGPGGTQLTLERIAQILAEKIEHFKIKTYPAASAVVYWFLDGVDRAEFDLKGGWTTLCEFAGEEFRRQRSLVTARHTAMMDPVAMAMAACLCARLQRMVRLQQLNAGLHLRKLPTMIELESSIRELFAEQTVSGLWPKYFPLFHYDDAGSNFCYTFELLEAVLSEFGGTESSALATDSILYGLERALTFCETGRLQTQGPENGDGPNILYRGWNSGGYLKTLQEAQPESWATAVVHMFLRELSDLLSAHIRQRLLRTYDADPAFLKFKPLSKMLDINVRLQGKEQALTTVLSDDLVKTFSAFKGNEFRKLLRAPAKGTLSALLFGPPGTSKTQVAKAIAAELQWPLVEVDPSRFLRKTFQNLYVEAEEIFNDMMDLYGVVILFDELDALVQKRGLESQDTESTFLTTYMLPKLAKLHDRRRSIFLMATNFEDRFDDAIKRAGRFDLLLCMGPPTLEEKCAKFHTFFDDNEKVLKAGRLLLEYAQKFPAVADQLALYTFGEFRSFVRNLGAAEAVHENLLELGAAGFWSRVQDDEKSVGLKLSDLKLLNVEGAEERRYRSSPYPWEKVSDLYPADFFEAKIPKELKLKPSIRYILERQRSKRQ